jgi:flagellar hook-associated protein 3 FlgL
MRITNQMTSLTLLSDTQRIQQRLLMLQRQAATGQRINEPSDDPIGAVSSLRLRSLLDRQDQFRANVAGGKNRLEATDAALSDLGQVTTDMKSLILEMSDESQTAESRQAAAASVAAALDQVLAIANRQQEGKSLFAGSKTNITPFVSQGGGIVYKGNSAQIQLAISEGQQIPVNLTGVEAFGATTSQVAGIVDLNPSATTSSKLVDLNNGRGVAKGSVLLGDGVTTQAIDLSAAESLGDVIDKLNTNT